MFKWCMEYPFLAFGFVVIVLITIDNVLSNFYKAKVAKYESRKENK